MKLKKYLDNPLELIFTYGIRGGLRFLSDEQYVKLMYRCRFGKKLDLNNPKTFNEKLQWLKVNDHNPFYTKLVDKYAVKKYVSKVIGEQHIIPTLGVWNKFDDIDFDSLPNQFVLKCTHDSGGLVICTDKSKLDKKAARKKIEKSLKRNYYWAGREWAYKGVKPRIIAEEYMENGNRGLVDYKFYCFNGKPEYLYISEGLSNHATANISFVDMDYNTAPFARSDYKPFKKLPKKPSSFNKMVELATILSQKFPFLRVDLYEINGEVYFSELTLVPCSGMMPFSPKKWDKKLGDMVSINQGEDE